MSETVSLSRLRLVALGIVVATANLVWGLLASLQPPFYPAEAERKGATTSQYGFVFGIYYLVACLSSPLFGRYGYMVGPKVMYNVGAFVQGAGGMLFGLLDYADDVTVFIVLSYLLRGLMGMADVAAYSAVLTILVRLFPGHSGRVVSWVELFFGLGFMVGPAVGSLLYELGGFKLPFLAVGSFGVAVAVAMAFVIPDVGGGGGNERQRGGGDGSTNGITFRDVIVRPSMLLPLLDVVFCFLGNGFLASMLEPHLRGVGATVVQVGMAFVAEGAAFIVASTVCGLVSDGIKYPTALSMLSNLCQLSIFTFVGPLPFIPIDPSLASINTCMALLGSANGLMLVSTFNRIQTASIRCGFQQDTHTHHFLSALWTSALFLGNFFGPTSGGFLVQLYGFPTATALFWGVFILAILVDLTELMYNIKQHRSIHTALYQQID